MDSADVCSHGSLSEREQSDPLARPGELAIVSESFLLDVAHGVSQDEVEEILRFDCLELDKLSVTQLER